MSNTLKVLHDRMLAEMPEGADHIALTCPICTPDQETASATTSTGGSVADKTYTQEEHDALLAQVADLTAKVAELSGSVEASQIDAKVAAATAELETKVADLQSQLDASVLEAEAAKQDRADTVAYLEGQVTAAAEAAALASRKDERLTKVKEVASFPDEYLEANADRFAAMSDEEFDKALEDWAIVAAKSSTVDAAAKTAASIPTTTAMTAARTSTETSNALREVMDLRSQGVDVRTV